MSFPVDAPSVEALGVLSRFRVEFYECLYARADALFELTDAVLCAGGPAMSLVELTLTAEHRRGHGAMCDGVNHGWLEPRRLRRLLASTPVPRAADGRIVLAVDVSNTGENGLGQGESTHVRRPRRPLIRGSDQPGHRQPEPPHADESGHVACGSAGVTPKR